MLIKILPFIIFISSMCHMKIRNNKDLLILKVFGYSIYNKFKQTGFYIIFIRLDYIIFCKTQ